MYKLSRFFVLAIAASAFLFAFNQRGVERHTSEGSLAYPMLEPGGKIDEMVITTGMEEAFPLWAICSPKKVNDHSIVADCGELSHANLGIGHTLGVMDLIPASIEWEELNWEMSLDGRPINLEAFGVYKFVHPSIAPSPSPVREVFGVLRVWDVVLVNPTPGTHRLQGQAQSPDGAEPYTWVVNFTIATPLN